MLLIEGISTQGIPSKQSYLTTTEDLYYWSPLLPILEPNKWLWNLTWKRGKAFGISTSNIFKDVEKREKQIDLLLSQNGSDYLPITSFDILGDPIDGGLTFYKDKPICIVQREAKGNNFAMVGNEPFSFLCVGMAGDTIPNKRSFFSGQ